jgi:putative solute:sodium symporter small subunit
MAWRGIGGPGTTYWRWSKNGFERSRFFVRALLVSLLNWAPLQNNQSGELMHAKNRSAYWRANLKLVALCLLIWFVCSFGFGILLVDELNQIRIGGFQLGFWFAQQGSIYIFVALIFFYAWRMNRMDQKFDVHED